MTKPRRHVHSCIGCCGPRNGPTRDALTVQVRSIQDELGQFIAAAAIDRGDEPLPTLVAFDMTARLRWRADHLERQVRDLGAVPAVPPFPGISDPQRWLDQIARAKAKQAEREAAA